MKDCYALNGGAVDSGAQPNLNDNPTSLVKAHLGMVDALATQLMKQNAHFTWLTESDLSGAGYEALVDAARAYDASREASFKTYAWHCVRNAMLAEIRRMFPIKVSDEQRGAVAIIRDNSEDTELDGVRPSLFDKFQSARLRCDWEPERKWQLEMLDEAMVQLEPEERFLVRCNFGFDGEKMTLEELADIAKVSPQAVHKRIKKAEAKLRAFIEGASSPYRLCA